MRLSCLLFCGVVLAGIPEKAVAQELVGRLVTQRADGRKVPLRGVPIKIVESDRRNITNDSGIFRLPLVPPGLGPGDDVTVEVEHPTWVLLNGHWRVPRRLPALVEFEAVRKGHPALLAPNELERFIQDRANRMASKALTREPTPTTKTAEHEASVKEFANARGFSIAQVQGKLDEWAREILAKSQDLHKRGLAHLALRQFDDAEICFAEAADISEKRLIDVRSQITEKEIEADALVGQMLQARLAEGAAAIQAGRLPRARAAYDRALVTIDRARHPRNWARVQESIGFVECHLAMASEGETIAPHVQQCLAAYRAALEVYTRDTMPEAWARTQNNLGNALQRQAQVTPAAIEPLLAQAMATYRAALEVRTKERFPREWATTQSNLAAAQGALGEHVAGDPATALLVEAVESLRVVAQVYAEQGLPHERARTQINLGIALTNLASRRTGDAPTQLLAEAVGALRSALETEKRPSAPDIWARIQVNLANTLHEQALHSAGATARTMLEEAIQADRLALEIFTREAQPQSWAALQSNLGNTLLAQAERSTGQPIDVLLTQAIAAIRAATQVYTRETLPLAWATCQLNYAAALRLQAERTPGPPGAQLAKEAVLALRAVLEIWTRTAAPRMWVRLQTSLGMTLDLQASHEGSNSAAGELLRQAVTAYRSALQELNPSALPREWGQTEKNLADALRAQANITRSDAVRAVLFAQAIDAYRGAVKVMDAVPFELAGTQNNLGATLWIQADDVGGRAAIELLTESVGWLRAALKFYRPDALPSAWIATQDNLAGALADLGSRTGGPEGRRMISESIALARASLERVSDELPLEQAKTRRNLELILDQYAQASIILHDWAEVRTTAARLRNDPGVSPAGRVAGSAYVILADIAQQAPAADDLDALIALGAHDLTTARGSRDASRVVTFAHGEPAFDRCRDQVESLLQLVESWTSTSLMTTLQSMRPALSACDRLP